MMVRPGVPGRQVKSFNLAARDVKVAFQHCTSPVLLVTARNGTGVGMGGLGGRLVVVVLV